jgi:hypothetical protein
MTPNLTRVTARIAPTIRAGALALTSALALSATADAEVIDLSARARAMNVAVIGDSVANDLKRGLQDLFERTPHVRVLDQTRFATGLVRTEYFNWNGTVRDFLKRQNPDAIVVVIGGNDRQPIRVNGIRLDPLSRPWLAEYERRVAHFMDTVKRSRAKVYWVGLPAVRADKLTAAYRVMNGVYRRQAARHGFAFVDIGSKFLTPDGAYSSFGQSLEGVKRQLREDDGMHFTQAGRLLFAHYVARAIGLR